MRTALVNIGQLVSASEETPPRIHVIENATLIVENGEIIAAGDGNHTVAEPDVTVDVDGAVVLPGFIDAHTHMVFAGNRAHELEDRAKGKSFQQITAAGGGIMSTVSQTRAADERALLEESLHHLSWCVRSGTTTIEVKSGYGLDLETELKMLLTIHRVAQTLGGSTGHPNTQRVFATFLGLHAVGPEFDGDHTAYIHHMIGEVLPLVHNTDLCSYVDAFIEPGYFSAEDAHRLAAEAKVYGLGVRLHVDQFSDSGGASLAAEVGAATADHLEHTSAEGIAALAKGTTIPVLLPGSVLGLGLTQYADARAMLDAGLPVVLATDFNPGSSPTPSIPFVMALANRMMHMTPDECLAAVTVNAARSLGLSDRGRLAPGQIADFSVWPIKDWREAVCWFDGPLPTSVWMSGKKIAG